MKNIFLIILIFLSVALYSQTDSHLAASSDNMIPLRGFCIGAPKPEKLDEFIKFITGELAPRHVNTLILMVNYEFTFQSHPELNESGSLTKADAARLVEACRKCNITIIPELDLLGHQSWASTAGALLRVYPEFDETPQVKLPEKYVWPNADLLYCKSYCPLHPGVHKVIFDLIDELCDAFQSDSFHCGMDEVFYLGESQCPRCSGKDKAELFAGEVTAIRNHLAEKGRRLWIWGDRLIDGKTTGIGEWEGSFNNTYRAIDMIPKDVLICDWHYERADQTAVYFAMKGFDVASCPWNNAASAVLQADDMVRFRDRSTPEMKDHFRGVVQTIWSGTDQFLDRFYGKKNENGDKSEVNCFKALFEEVNKN
jgi:N-acetyl-beta-hexosaminidase